MRAPQECCAPNCLRSQARRCEEVVWQFETISPLVVRSIDITSRGIWPVICYPVKIVIAASVQAVRRIGDKTTRVRRTSIRNQLGESLGTPAGIKRRPMGATLERPDPVELPIAEHGSPNLPIEPESTPR